MNIAVIQETFYPFHGGSAKRVYEVFRRLVKRGHEVHIYTMRMKKSWPPYEVIDGLQIHRVITGKLITPTGFRYIDDVFKFSFVILRKLLRENNFNIYEANHCPMFPLWSTFFATKIKNKPVSGTFHECWHDDWLRWSPNKAIAYAGKICEKITTVLPDILITPTHFVKERLFELLRVPDHKIRVISNGVDLKSFDGTEVQKEWGKVIYVGRLNPHKRVDVLLHAYKRIKEETPSVSLEIIGEGPERPTLELLSEKLKLKDVEFLGAVNESTKIKELKSAWINVIPSQREGQSIALLEAMAAGTPCIATEANGCNAVSEVIMDQVNGMLIDLSVDSVYKGINLLLEDEKTWRRLRTGGLSYVKDFDWDASAKLYEEVYDGLL